MGYQDKQKQGGKPPDGSVIFLSTIRKGAFFAMALPIFLQPEAKSLFVNR
jgi:hypothetical protein